MYSCYYVSISLEDPDLGERMPFINGYVHLNFFLDYIPASNRGVEDFKIRPDTIFVDLT